MLLIKFNIFGKSIGNFNAHSLINILSHYISVCSLLLHFLLAINRHIKRIFFMKKKKCVINVWKFRRYFIMFVIIYLNDGIFHSSLRQQKGKKTSNCRFYLKFYNSYSCVEHFNSWFLLFIYWQPITFISFYYYYFVVV